MDKKYEIQELLQEIENIKIKIAKLSKDALHILNEDIRKFVEREIKKQFLRFPKFAESLDKEQIKALKNEIKQRTPPVVEKIIESMKNRDVWLKGLEYESGEKNLAENTALWTLIGPIEQVTMEILLKYKFPGLEDIVIEYKQPTWFISGKFLPTIAEKYWKALKEIKEIQTKIEELKNEDVKENLSKKWDEV